MSKGLPTSDIIEIQREIGTAPDGIWGPKSKAACKAFLQTLKPKVNPWPATDVQSLLRFYGRPGDESKLVMVDFTIPTFYEGRLVRSFRCHYKVADSLIHVLTNIRDKFGSDRDVVDEVENYDGVYNFRPKRGGTSWSLHAYGAAIDLDANENSYKDNWPTHGDMNWDIIKEFAKEGWVSAAGEWGYDPMHFQATKPTS